MAIDERLVFYEGKHIRLKVLSSQDIVESDWVGWFNDEDMSQYNQHHYFPNTMDMQRSVLESLGAPSKLQLGIVDRTAPAQICGVVSLSDISWIHRNAEIGGIQDRRRTSASPAVFLEAWALVLRHGFDQLGLKKIYGSTFHPHVAPALVRVFNFEIEGTRRQHVYRNGKYRDITMVSVFSDTIRYPEF